MNNFTDVYETTEPVAKLEVPISTKVPIAEQDIFENDRNAALKAPTEKISPTYKLIRETFSELHLFSKVCKLTYQNLSKDALKIVRKNWQNCSPKKIPKKI